MPPTNLNQYYQQQGKPLPSVQERAGIYGSMGLGGANEYQGTLEQNTKLLQALQTTAASPAAPPTAPKPPQTVPSQPQAAPVQPQGQPSGGVDTSALEKALVAKGYNPTDAANAARGPRAAELAREYGVSTGAPGVVGMGTGQPPAIDLQAIYDSALKGKEYEKLTAAVDEAQAKVTQRRDDLAKATNQINENPFLSEASRTGRIRRLTEYAQADINNYINEQSVAQAKVAMAEADAKLKVDLATKQYDINSQTAQQALSQFSTLLEAGALDNASGDDIASITRSTGLSSGVIQNAIHNKKVAGYTTTMQSFDDNVNEGFIIYTIDPMGNVINETRQVTGKSSKAAAKTSYSADPFVSSFMEQLLGQGNTSTDSGGISLNWDE